MVKSSCPVTVRPPMKKSSFILRPKRARVFCCSTSTNIQTNKHNERKLSMNQYQKLYTPADSAIAFIDFQPQMLFGVASMDRASLINNVTLLAKVAKEYNIPTLLSSVETESFSG